MAVTGALQFGIFAFTEGIIFVFSKICFSHIHVSHALNGTPISKALTCYDVWQFKCTNKNGNFVKETDTSDDIIVGTIYSSHYQICSFWALGSMLINPFSYFMLYPVCIIVACWVKLNTDVNHVSMDKNYN